MQVLVLSVALSFGVQLVFSFCADISVVLFYTLEISRCSNVISIESSSLALIGLIRDLFVSYIDSLMG